MNRLNWLVLLAFLLAACGSPAPAPTAEQQAFSVAEVECQTLKTFDDQSYIQYCQNVPGTQVPDDVATETATAEVATDTPAPPTDTAVPTTEVPLPTETDQPTDTPAPTETVPASGTPLPTETALATGTPRPPYPGAPLCPDTGELHDPSLFHTLWDANRGCHYDHEHGANPFTPAVVAAFPGFDLLALNCGVPIGHCNPSSPIENAVLAGKHGGFKYDVVLNTFTGCNGFESAPTGAKSAVVQYHGFGDPARELSARVHSIAVLVKQCRVGNPNDFGYLYRVSWQDYGQRISPYQGDLVPYPDNPQPPYDTPRGPYLSFDCVGTKTGPVGQPGHLGECRLSLASVLAGNNGLGLNVSSVWAGKPTGAGGLSVLVDRIVQALWRVRDGYALYNWASRPGTPTFSYLCSNDNGATYTPKVGCRYNNTTTTIHELAGEVPASWDQAAFDTDNRVGRVTTTGFTDRYGNWVPSGGCVQPGTNCFPVKMVNAFTGKWGAALQDNKLVFSIPVLLERDVYFCGQNMCNETSPGAVASGWVGRDN